MNSLIFIMWWWKSKNINQPFKTMTGDKNYKMLLILRARLIAYVIHMWTEKLFIKPFPSAILWQEKALICFIVYDEYACKDVYQKYKLWYIFDLCDALSVYTKNTLEKKYSWNNCRYAMNFNIRCKGYLLGEFKTRVFFPLGKYEFGYQRELWSLLR